MDFVTQISLCLQKIFFFEGPLKNTKRAFEKYKPGAYYPYQTSVDLRFFRPASLTVGFSLRFKNSGHVITFLWLCGLQKHRSCNAILVFPTEWLSHVSPFFVEVQRKERCPL